MEHTQHTVQEKNLFYCKIRKLLCIFGQSFKLSSIMYTIDRFFFFFRFFFIRSLSLFLRIDLLSLLFFFYFIHLLLNLRLVIIVFARQSNSFIYHFVSQFNLCIRKKKKKLNKSNQNVIFFFDHIYVIGI